MGHGDPEPDIQIEFFGRPKLLAVIRRALDTLCDRSGLMPDECSRVCLAVDEAVCNVIRHGYGEDPDARIELRVTVVGDPPDELIIEILDRAPKVDLAKIRSRDLNDIRPGGLGVHIISEIMDQVDYRHRDGGGMHLIMRYVIKAPMPSGSSQNDG